MSERWNEVRSAMKKFGEVNAIVAEEDRRTSKRLLKIGAVAGGAVVGGLGFYFFGVSGGLICLAIGVLIGSIGLWLMYQTTSLLS